MKLTQITGVTPPATRFTNYATLPGDLTSRVLLFAATFAGFVFLVQLVMAAFTMMTSTGEPGKVAAAKKSLTNAVIGLIVTVGAYFLAQILFSILGLNVL